MTKLAAYESALTLYGLIFSQLPDKNSRYFLGTIKRDFVFFIFALIWKGAGGASELKSKTRLIPRNFNEWTFGNRTILSPTGECFSADLRAIWNIDRDYFRKNAPLLKNASGIAILGSGIDLEKSFDLETLAREREIRAVIKKSWRSDIQALPFFAKNFTTLFSIYRILKKNCELRCSLLAFSRYFVYYAFASARFRAVVANATRDKRIGKFMSSDLDNVIGNSFILWGRYYGLAQIAYPHGSPVSLNKNRYFEPEEYYIWTIYQKKYAEEISSNNRLKYIYYPPKWVSQTYSRLNASREVKKITIVTAMEENLEIPFGNRGALLDYIEEIAKFAAPKHIQVFIKSHKLLDWHDDYDALCKKYSNVTHVRKRWRTEQLQETDIGILVNTSTTMALQLLSLGIPVITCKEVMSEIVPKHFSAPYLAPMAKNKFELLKVVEKLHSDMAYYRRLENNGSETFRKIIKDP